MAYTSEDILCALLDCGTADLTMLSKCGYDLDDIIRGMRYRGRNISLESILDEVFLTGQSDLRKAVEHTTAVIIETMDSLMEEKDEAVEWQAPDERVEALDETIRNLQEELEDIRGLSPLEDMTWYINCLDTNCRLEDGETYRKYFSEDLERIEGLMGFTFR